MSSNINKKDLIKEILVKNKDKINKTIDEKDINLVNTETNQETNTELNTSFNIPSNVENEVKVINTETESVSTETNTNTPTENETESASTESANTNIEIKDSENEIQTNTENELEQKDDTIEVSETSSEESEISSSEGETSSSESEDEGEVEPLVDNGANVIQAELDNTIDEEIDLFDESNDVIVLKNKEIAPEYEQIYEDDIVYIKDIENELLKEVPINRQNNKLVQEAITKQAQNLVELKNLGKELVNKDANYSQVFYDILNNQYPHNIIVPIVLDKQRVYVNTEEEADDTLIKEELETNDEIESSVSIQLKKIKSLSDAFKNGDITYEKYETDKRNILKPFIVKKIIKNEDEIEFEDEGEETEVGFQHSLKENVDLLRLYGINTTEYQQYRGLTDLTTTIEIYDDNNVYKGLKEKIVIPADDVNIVGFLILPSNAETLDEILIKLAVKRQ